MQRPWSTLWPLVRRDLRQFSTAARKILNNKKMLVINVFVLIFKFIHFCYAIVIYIYSTPLLALRCHTDRLRCDAVMRFQSFKDILCTKKQFHQMRTRENNIHSIWLLSIVIVAIIFIEINREQSSEIGLFPRNSSSIVKNLQCEKSVISASNRWNKFYLQFGKNTEKENETRK